MRRRRCSRSIRATPTRTTPTARSGCAAAFSPIPRCCATSSTTPAPTPRGSGRPPSARRSPSPSGRIARSRTPPGRRCSSCRSSPATRPGTSPRRRSGSGTTTGRSAGCPATRASTARGSTPSPRDSDAPVVLICESRQVGEALVAPGEPVLDPAVRIVHTTHACHVLAPFTWDSPMDAAWERWLAVADRFDAVLWLTPSQRRDVERRAGGGIRSFVVPHPAPEPSARPGVARAGPDRHAELAHPAQAHRPRAARARGRARAIDPEAHLHVYGDGAQREELERLAARARRRGRRRLPGSRLRSVARVGGGGRVPAHQHERGAGARGARGAQRPGCRWSATTCPTVRATPSRTAAGCSSPTATSTRSPTPSVRVIRDRGAARSALGGGSRGGTTDGCRGLDARAGDGRADRPRRARRALRRPRGRQKISSPRTISQIEEAEATPRPRSRAPPGGTRRAVAADPRANDHDRQQNRRRRSR